MGGIYLGGLGCLRWACGGVRMNCRYTDEKLKEDVEIRKSRPWPASACLETRLMLDA